MTATKQIPEKLIYEMDNGIPIYYSGYHDYLSGKKVGETMRVCSNLLQSLIASNLLYHVGSTICSKYLVLANQLGISIAKGSWRLADIAIVKQTRVKAINDEFLQMPPNVVFEIDTKAALEDYDNPGDYYTLKTKHYLDFGVDKVIWIYTKDRSIEVSSSSGKDTFTWNDEVVFLDKYSFCLMDIMGDLIE